MKQRTVASSIRSVKRCRVEETFAGCMRQIFVFFNKARGNHLTNFPKLLNEIRDRGKITTSLNCSMISVTVEKMAFNTQPCKLNNSKQQQCYSPFGPYFSKLDFTCSSVSPVFSFTLKFSKTSDADFVCALSISEGEQTN